jgi:hypothetical protein
MQPDGGFVVVWETTMEYQPSSGGYNSGIRMMICDSEGNVTVGMEVGSGDSPDEYDPAVANSWSTWQWMAVWTAMDRDGSGEGIFTWEPYHSNSSVNTFTTGHQASPSVAMDSAGNSVVVWCSQDQDGDAGGIYGQRFSSDGNKSGAEFSVNSYTSGDQDTPSVAMDSAGDFVVVWASYGQDGDGWGVYGQRFSSLGMKLGSEFRVNTYTSSDQYRPSVSMSATGEFVVVWASAGQDGSGQAVVGQRYYSDGTSLGMEFLVNSYHSGDQTLPCVSCNGIGDFIVVWQSDGQDGSGWGVFGQLYNKQPIPEFTTLAVPVALTTAVFLALRRRRTA